MTKYVHFRVGKIVGKGENTANQHLFLFMPPYRKIERGGDEDISHQYASASTKVKVICKGQGQVYMLHLSKNGRFRGIHASQTHLVPQCFPESPSLGWLKFQRVSERVKHSNKKLRSRRCSTYSRQL